MKSLGPPISQVSHSGLSPTPPILHYSPLILLPNCPPSIFPQLYHKCFHYLPFCTIICSPVALFPSLLPPFHFSLFWGILMVSPCFKHLPPPVHIMLDCFFIPLIPCMTHPTLFPLPALILTHFHFCNPFMDNFLC
jgi:hypothetical protein